MVPETTIPGPNLFTPYSSIAWSISDLYAGDTVADVVYVTENGSGDGSSWDTAANASDLWTKLAALNDPGAGKVSFLLVGAGTYTVQQALAMEKRVAIVGGWSAVSSSPWERNEGDTTVFDGNNSYRVFDNQGEVNSDPFTDKAMLHSVTVSNGSVTGDGAGMYNNSFSPTLINVTFLNNQATLETGVGWITPIIPLPTLINVTFFGQFRQH